MKLSILLGLFASASLCQAYEDAYTTFDTGKRRIEHYGSGVTARSAVRKVYGYGLKPLKEGQVYGVKNGKVLILDPGEAKKFNVVHTTTDPKKIEAFQAKKNAKAQQTKLQGAKLQGSSLR